MGEIVQAAFSAPTIEPISPTRRLRRRLDIALSYDIVEIVAGAGFGKTTILEHFAARGETVIARLRPSQEPILDLLRAICDAAAGFAAGAKVTVNEAYANAHFHDDSIGALAAWWNSHLAGAEHRIAIDDLHLLETNVGAWEMIEKLVEHTRGRVDWILSSRAPLQLPTSIWIATGRMGMPLTVDDLAFTEEDLAEIANAQSVTIEPVDRRRIIERTLGWPLVTSHIVKIWDQRRDEATAIEEARARGIDAVAESLWGRLTEAEREILLVASLLDAAWPSLLREAGFANADALLASLPGRGAPISRDRTGAYRVHDLLREYLFEHERPALDAAGRATIGALIEADNCVDALQIATRLRAADKIAEVIGGQPTLFMDPDDAGLIDRALSIIPSRTRNTDAALLAVGGARAYRNANLDRATVLWQRAIETAEGNLRATVARRLALLILNRGTTGAHALLDIADASVESTNVTEMAEIASLRGLAHGQAGNHESARIAMDDALRHVAHSDDARLRARIFQRAGTVSFFADRLNEAQELATEASWIAESEGAQAIIARVQILLYTIAMAKGEPSYIAAFHAEQTALAAARAADRPSMRTALIALFLLSVEEGDRDRALHLRERLRGVGSTATFQAGYLIAQAQALLEALDGRYAAATTVLEHVPDAEMRPAERAERDALLALVCALGEDEQAADDHAREALRQTRALRDTVAPHDRRTVELANLIGAAVRLRLGKRYEASRALSMSRRSRLDSIRALARTVSRLGRDSSSDLESNHGLAGYRVLLERLFKRQASGSVALTSSERRILTLLAEGNTTKEIATYLGRAPSTIDNHVFSLMHKLGARNRLEAVSVARDRMLLP